MKPVCAVGDLAMVIKSKSGNHGRIVSIVAPHNGVFQSASGMAIYCPGLSWMFEPPLPTSDGKTTWAAMDEQLLPLRNPPDDAEDFRDIKLGEAMRTQVRDDVARTPALIGQGGEA